MSIVSWADLKIQLNSHHVIIANDYEVSRVCKVSRSWILNVKCCCLEQALGLIGAEIHPLQALLISSPRHQLLEFTILNDDFYSFHIFSLIIGLNYLKTNISLHLYFCLYSTVRTAFLFFRRSIEKSIYAYFTNVDCFHAVIFAYINTPTPLLCRCHFHHIL